MKSSDFYQKTKFKEIGKMKNIDNANLPAMPTHYAEITNCMGGTDELFADQKGLTKREDIAKDAMKGMLASGNYTDPHAIADGAVIYADALLDALEKREKLENSSKPKL
ncbi:hypothetical protein NVP1154O_46 [Vibrio phage 1.154.O._10N.222.52.B12]|nr:hypothetical protein NVP1154O_46 [Vibrio phage 1.154.O._10N.222.52.B12]